MDLILDNLGLLSRGLLVTLKMAFITLALTTLVSVLLGLMRVATFMPLRLISLAIVEFCRDIPLIVNLLFVYFGAPLLGVPLDPFWAAVTSFTIWGGANGAEIVRGGFNAVPAHQRETAEALGLKRWEITWFIIGPQVILPILPPFTGLLSIMIQATSLASLVGAMEFFRTAQIIVERETLMTGSSPAFAVYFFVLCVYFCICFSLAMLTRRLEVRLSAPARRRGMAVENLDQQVSESI